MTGSPLFFLVGGSFDTGLLDLIYQSSPIVKIVFLILMAFSVLSWAIIFRKLVLFRKVEGQS